MDFEDHTERMFVITHTHTDIHTLRHTHSHTLIHIHTLTLFLERMINYLKIKWNHRDPKLLQRVEWGRKDPKREGGVEESMFSLHGETNKQMKRLHYKDLTFLTAVAAPELMVMLSQSVNEPHQFTQQTFLLFQQVFLRIEGLGL